jgi:beta-N-acetylhexosaminidase
MGVNVNYSPDCDVNSNPDNPNVGVRSFGDDPKLVAEMGTAMIKGLQESGVAATAKHFPGNGESEMDPHFGIPVLAHNLKRLQSIEFVPFQGAIDAGVKLMMSAHVSLPEITGESDLPATLSPEIMGKLLRDDMGFRGLLISDALDMKAINQGEGKIIDVIAAVRAGIDLLLMAADGEVQRRLFSGLVQALKRGLLDQDSVSQSIDRILTLKQWVSGQPQLGLDVVGCPDHRQLDSAVAARSITLVKNDADLIPLSLEPDSSVVTIMPHPTDLTPADTSNFVVPNMAECIRKYHHRVEEILIDQRPAPQSIAELCGRAANYDLIVMGTISAHLQQEQANLVNRLLAVDVPLITVALRTPYDLTVYPQADTHVCTYGIQPSSMAALADALFGQVPFQGKLPVTIPGETEFGHGLSV